MPIPQVPSQLTSILATGTYDSNWFSGSTLEVQIQNAINSAAADGAPRVLVHESYDASLITFNNAVQMVKEGQNWSIWDVAAYGAVGDGVTNDTIAIQAALNAAGSVVVSGVGGAEIVSLPHGQFQVSTTITVPNGVRLIGHGRRTSEIRTHGNWPNPTPNVIIRLGAAGAGVIFGARCESLAANAQGRAGVVCFYGEALQTSAGWIDCLARAFGAAGFQTRIGTGPAPLTNNDYDLIQCEATNGISATGLGFDLDAGAGGTFSPVIMGLSHSNASFPSNLNPAGFSFKNGPFSCYRLASEFAVDGVLVDDTASAMIVGMHGNLCTNVVTKTNAKIVLVGITRSGGTNLVKDNSGPDNQITAAMCSIYDGSSDSGGTAQAGPYFARGQIQIQRTSAALAAGSNNNYSVLSRGTVRLPINAGGSAISGIVAGAPGQRLLLFKISGGTFTITNDDGASTAANRILTPTAATITVTFSAELEYDGTTARWRVVSFV